MRIVAAVVLSLFLAIECCQSAPGADLQQRSRVTRNEHLAPRIYIHTATFLDIVACVQRLPTMSPANKSITTVQSGAIGRNQPGPPAGKTRRLFFTRADLQRGLQGAARYFAFSAAGAGLLTVGVPFVFTAAWSIGGGILAVVSILHPESRWPRALSAVLTNVFFLSGLGSLFVAVFMLQLPFVWPLLSAGWLVTSVGAALLFAAHAGASALSRAETRWVRRGAWLLPVLAGIGIWIGIHPNVSISQEQNLLRQAEDKLRTAIDSFTQDEQNLTEQLPRFQERSEQLQQQINTLRMESVSTQEQISAIDRQIEALAVQTPEPDADVRGPVPAPSEDTATLPQETELMRRQQKMSAEAHRTIADFVERFKTDASAPKAESPFAVGLSGRGAVIIRGDITEAQAVQEIWHAFDEKPGNINAALQLMAGTKNSLTREVYSNDLVEKLTKVDWPAVFAEGKFTRQVRYALLAYQNYFQEAVRADGYFLAVADVVRVDGWFGVRTQAAPTILDMIKIVKAGEALVQIQEDVSSLTAETAQPAASAVQAEAASESARAFAERIAAEREQLSIRREHFTRALAEQNARMENFQRQQAAAIEEYRRVEQVLIPAAADRRVAAESELELRAAMRSMNLITHIPAIAASATAIVLGLFLELFFGKQNKWAHPRENGDAPAIAVPDSKAADERVVDLSEEPYYDSREIVDNLRKAAVSPLGKTSSLFAFLQRLLEAADPETAAVALQAGVLLAKGNGVDPENFSADLKKALNEAYVVIGMAAEKKPDPEKFLLDVMNRARKLVHRAAAGNIPADDVHLRSSARRDAGFAGDGLRKDKQELLKIIVQMRGIVDTAVLKRMPVEDDYRFNAELNACEQQVAAAADIVSLAAALLRAERVMFTQDIVGQVVAQYDSEGAARIKEMVEQYLNEIFQNGAVDQIEDGFFAEVRAAAEIIPLYDVVDDALFERSI
ncbi:MAG: hypothetical protein NC924_01655 [Candidatus Omnitrophica bacterium]|nr:hypothetical protein [Candidatus Omnitrophota bacterium]